MGVGSPGNPIDDGGRRKRKKGMTVNLQDFPEWFNEDYSNINQEVYIHVKAKEGDVPIARRNRFLLAKILKEKTTHITKASFNAEGDMILKIKGEKEAEKILAMKSIGSWPVTVEKHRTLNSSKGVIFCPDMCWLKEQEVVEGLSDYKVSEVYIFKRTPRNGDSGANKEPRPYGLAILTFNSQEPPKRIKYGFEYIDVRHYIPNPKRCRKCQKLGHTTKWCKSTTEICAECGQDNLQNHSCGMKMCVNCCKPGHASNSRDCPTYIMHKEWEAIMVLQKKTKYEAKQAFFAKYQSLEGFMATKNKNMAQIVGCTGVSQGQATTSISSTTTPKNSNNMATENNNTGSEKNTSTNIQQNVNNDKDKTKGSTTEEKQPQTTNNKSTSEQDKKNKEVSTVGKTLDTDRINSYLKLKDWKRSATGITFILDNHIRGGGVPRVDVSSFKGQKTDKKEKILKYAVEVLSKEDVIGSIVKEVAKHSKCSSVTVIIEKGRARVLATAEDDDTGSEGHTSVEEGQMSIDED